MKARHVLACVALAAVAYPLGYVAALWLSTGSCIAEVLPTPPKRSAGHKAQIRRLLANITSDRHRTSLDRYRNQGPALPPLLLPREDDMTPVWCARSREGWCAVIPDEEPAEGSWSVATVCGFGITLPGGYDHRRPTCSDCLALFSERTTP